MVTKYYLLMVIASYLTDICISDRFILQDIDAHLDKVTDQGYAAVLSLGSRGFNYATNVVLTTAIKVTV